MNNKDAIISLAGEVLDVARNRLLVNLRYMDTALSFHARNIYEGTVGTDGRAIHYAPEYVLRTYRESKESLTRAYLHTVLHCVFSHPMVSGSIDRRLWDIACDIAVESAINEIGLVCTSSGREGRQTEACRRIRRESGMLTAEKIYSALRKGFFAREEIDEWEALFSRDDHSLWYDKEESSGDSSGQNTQLRAAQDMQLVEEWRRIAGQIILELEMFAKVRGRYSSSLVQNLRAVTREKYDYSEFLRRFTRVHENLRVSEDEFDQIYYTYGLTSYGNMPLIEPLEYREDRKIHDFVIAIDTSGSVAGEEVQQFLQKTYNILKRSESLDRIVNIHMVQCDAEIQSDTVIRSTDDLDRYIDNMEIRGLGGTDFRPVFTYVDDLVRRGELKDLSGLLYFTDGLGTFPPHMPGYKTAFVFIDNGYNIPEVPPWAIKIVLDSGII